MASHKDPKKLHLDLSTPLGPEKDSLWAVIGRGGGSNHDTDTIFYREFVEPFKFEYLNATREHKPEIVEHIIATFKASGRKIVGFWADQYYELTPKGYKKKVQQRLRERGPEYLIGLLRDHTSEQEFASYRNPLPGADRAVVNAANQEVAPVSAANHVPMEVAPVAASSAASAAAVPPSLPSLVPPSPVAEGIPAPRFFVPAIPPPPLPALPEAAPVPRVEEADAPRVAAAEGIPQGVAQQEEVPRLPQGAIPRVEEAHAPRVAAADGLPQVVIQEGVPRLPQGAIAAPPQNLLDIPNLDDVFDMELDDDFAIDDDPLFIGLGFNFDDDGADSLANMDFVIGD